MHLCTFIIWYLGPTETMVKANQFEKHPPPPFFLMLKFWVETCES